MASTHQSRSFSPASIDHWKSLGDFAVWRLQALKDVPVLIDDVERSRVETLSGDLVLHRAIRVAACLRARGLKSGDVLAIFCEWPTDAVCVTLASFLLGITIALIDVDLDQRELRHAIHSSQPTMVFVTARTIAAITSVLPSCPSVRHVCVFGDEFLGRSHMLSFNVFVRNAKIRTPPLKDFRFELQPIDTRNALIAFDCDNIGRFRSTVASQRDVLDALHENQRNDGDPKRVARTATISQMMDVGWSTLDNIVQNLGAIFKLSAMLIPARL